MSIKNIVKEKMRPDGRVTLLYQLLFGKIKKKIVGSGNSIEYQGAFIKNSAIKVKGNNNRIIVQPRSYLNGVEITIYGDNNVLLIGEKCNLVGTGLWIEDSCNGIEIGRGTTISDRTHLTVCESTTITVGEDCMLSSDLYIATGDAHSIVNNAGDRMNHSENIKIDSHVWIGTRAILLKGAVIPFGCIIGAGSIVSGKFNSENSIIAGVPAKVLKEDRFWKRERI